MFISFIKSYQSLLTLTKSLLFQILLINSIASPITCTCNMSYSNNPNPLLIPDQTINSSTPFFSGNNYNYSTLDFLNQDINDIQSNTCISPMITTINNPNHTATTYNPHTNQQFINETNLNMKNANAIYYNQRMPIVYNKTTPVFANHLLNDLPASANSPVSPPNRHVFHIDFPNVEYSKFDYIDSCDIKNIVF